MKKQIKFNIWNFMDVDDINDILDDTLADSKVKGIATDIKYNISDIDSNGNIKVDTEFILEKI